MTHTTRTASGPVAPTAGALRPLGLDEVTITGGFWADRQAVNARATLPHIRHWLEKEGWLGNFDLAAQGTLPEGRRGREFSDSEVYKYLEAAAWELGRSSDPELQADFDAVVDRVAAAQEPDGYLNTMFGRQGQRPRWSDLEWGHELYVLGHLFQAAVARLRTGHDRTDPLVAVAARAADMVCENFGERGIQSVCGHAEIEVGMAEFGRAMGDQRYLDQARLFIDRRGKGTLADIEWGREYFQDDVPVREATVLRGHAVRANYLSAGAVDVAIESDDTELLDALAVQWDNTVARRTYITGGQGSHHTGESFGEDWVLPPDRAYSETCAAVGSIMFSWRMLLASGGSKYADLIERSLYNVVATSPAQDGKSFFYANTLHRRLPDAPVDMDEISPRAASSLRAPWFEVACCPPNVARTFASLAAYIATATDDGVQLQQYASARIRTTIGGGRVVAFDVQTDYPVSGRIRVVIDETPDDAWQLTLRVPEWAGSASLTVDGRSTTVAPGPVTVDRVFRQGEVIELELPMKPRFVVPSSRIDAVRGTVAVERGPEVFALESVDAGAQPDLGGIAFADLVVDTSQPPVEDDGTVWINLERVRDRETQWPYTAEPTSEIDASTSRRVALVRYHDWAQRGPSSMRVWIPTAG